MAFELIITLDYELPADGLGDVRRQMINPTRALIEACEEQGAKLTIMLEIGEFWAFDDPRNSAFKRSIGYDPAQEIRDQLTDAVQRGHDVQLHLHPHWLEAAWIQETWHLNYGCYYLTCLEDEEMVSVLKRGKTELESMLRPVHSDYECIGFRAGHWATAPSDRYLTALREAGLESDTSVFKWGSAGNGALSYDYRHAFSNVEAWYSDPSDISLSSPEGSILEVPIATELSGILGMVTPKRLSLLRTLYLGEDRQIARSLHATHSGREAKSSFQLVGAIRKLKRLIGKHPKKLDFCKLTSREMLSMVERFVHESEAFDTSLPIPLVMIGHSKQGDSRDLRLFLEGLRRQIREDIGFSTYRSFVRTYESGVGRNGGEKR